LRLPISIVVALMLTAVAAGDGVLRPAWSGPFPSRARIAPDEVLIPVQSIMTPPDDVQRRASVTTPNNITASPVPPSGIPPNPAAPTADRLNTNIVTVITEPVGGALASMGSDMASVLDEGDTLRVLPINGRGSVQNLVDILRLRNVDAGFVLADALPFVKAEYGIANLEQRVSYIMKVFNAEVHIVARSDINSVRELEGKRIFAERNIGYASVRTIFSRLRIRADIDSQTDGVLGLQRLLNGEADAWIVTAGKVAPLIRSIRNDGRFHLVPIPYDRSLQDIYLPSVLTSADYPNLIAPGTGVDTLAVSALLMVYNWPVGTERYNKVAKLIDALFRRLGQLQQPPRHPKWREAAITAAVPGLQRFKAAGDWLRLSGRLTDAANATLARKLLQAPAPGDRDFYGEFALRHVDRRR
jgi:TRAP-type uncharacterized transport system substrate-binding protein